MSKLIQEIIKYKTSDDLCFNTKQEALNHEHDLAIFEGLKVIYEKSRDPNEKYSSMFNFIIKNKKKYLNFSICQDIIWKCDRNETL